MIQYAGPIVRGRRSNRIGIRTLAILPLLALSAGCASNSSPTPQATASVDTVSLREALSVLAADSLHGRLAGSRGAAQAAAFIAERLRQYGVQPAFGAGEGRNSEYFQGVPLAQGENPGRLRLMESWEAHDALPADQRVEDVNVVGIIRGSDPTLRDEAIVVGAHFDHVGIGPAVDGDSIYNGADDDASGVVTVLEIARALTSGPPPARTVILLLTTAEEHGMLGTRWYVDNPVVPLERTVADLQIEMVGRPDEAAGGAGKAWLTGYPRSNIGPVLAAAGLSVIDDPRPDQRFFQRSDNIVFACAGVPAHTLSSFGLHGDYHGPGDEVERIDFAHMAQVVDAATRAVRLLANGERPEWAVDGDPSTDPAICR